MIPVVCAECGANFEIGDEFAGLCEYCPTCGTLNDVPNLEVLPPDILPPEVTFVPEQQQANVFPTSPTAASTSRGIPAALWWTILISGIAAFLLACIYLFSDTWEAKHIQALSDAANRGDVLLNDEDYPGAIKQYRFVLDTVGHRTIDSAFILHLVDRARHGVMEADNHLNAPKASIPQTQPTATTQPEVVFHLALKSFQHDYEDFPHFVRDHPILFQDGKGNWRRRQFFVWQVSYDQPPESESPKILLRYNCSSNITAPHADRAQALGDDNFIDDESPKTIHCQTQFEWLSGRWLIAHHDADVQTDATVSMNVRPSLDDFYSLERLAFRIPASR